MLAYDRKEPLLGDDGNPVTRWDGETMKLHPVTGEEVPDESAQAVGGADSYQSFGLLLLTIRGLFDAIELLTPARAAIDSSVKEGSRFSQPIDKATLAFRSQRTPKDRSPDTHPRRRLRACT